METDDAIMLAVRAGRLDAMGTLFERHHQRMYRFFRRSIPDHSGCEDLVQNLFLRMLAYRSSYRGGGSFTSWMYRTAIRLRDDHLRKSGRERSSYSADPVDEIPVPQPEALGRADEARLRAALDALRPAERDVLILTRFEGLPHAEVAAILDCSVGALKVRIHRALHSLRSRWLEREAPWI